MTKHILFKYLAIIMTWCFVMVVITCPGQTQESEPKDDDLLVFVSNSPAEQEVKEKITHVLAQNMEKAQKINRHQEQRAATGGYYGSGYHLLCTNFYLSQKQMELIQWQYQITSDDEARDILVRKIMSTYVDQVDAATHAASLAEKLRKMGMIEDRECIDAEITLDQTLQERLRYHSTNQPKEAGGDQFLELLENNVKKAENLVKEYQYIGLPPRRISTTPFSRHFADYYLHQKQIEPQRWQYDNTKDDESRRTVAEQLIATYEKQLVTTQKLVDLSKELFQQYKATTATCLYCQTLQDRDNFEMEVFKLTRLNEDGRGNGDISDQITQILQDQLEKAQSICDDYEKEHRKDLETKRSPPRTTAVGQNQTKYYFQQKQVELYRWQYENAREPDARREFAKKLMDVYKEQWTTAKVLAEAGREAWDIGMITMKDYLDCEAKLDRTTVDMLKFMLQTVE